MVLYDNVAVFADRNFALTILRLLLSTAVSQARGSLSKSVVERDWTSPLHFDNAA